MIAKMLGVLGWRLCLPVQPITIRSRHHVLVCVPRKISFRVAGNNNSAADWPAAPPAVPGILLDDLDISDSSDSESDNSTTEESANATVQPTGDAWTRDFLHRRVAARGRELDCNAVSLMSIPP